MSITTEMEAEANARVARWIDFATQFHNPGWVAIGDLNAVQLEEICRYYSLTMDELISFRTEAAKLDFDWTDFLTYPPTDLGVFHEIDECVMHWLDADCRRVPGATETAAERHFGFAPDDVMWNWLYLQTAFWEAHKSKLFDLSAPVTRCDAYVPIKSLDGYRRLVLERINIATKWVEYGVEAGYWYIVGHGPASETDFTDHVQWTKTIEKAALAREESRANAA